MKKLELLVIHCTATKATMKVIGDDIRRWHLGKPIYVTRAGKQVNTGGRGWSQVGYSDLIKIDGAIERLVNYDEDAYVQGWEITNGVANHNSNARHVVYAGGVDQFGKPHDTRNAAQLITLEKYVRATILVHPDIKVCGHNQFDSGKACPSFDVPKWLRFLGIDDKNIFKA